MNILGKQFIDGARISVGTTTFASYDATSGEALPHVFYAATATEIDAAATAAAGAYPLYRIRGVAERAQFLDTIAAEIEALDDAFVHLVIRETGLPEARIRGERLRTTNQLRFFAKIVRRGDFLRVCIDTAQPERTPLPRQDIRQYRIGIGPVAVFGASNFPLAFSVAGGDTAAALAAGCPVVVKAHSSHPATADLIAQAIGKAVERCGMPTGVFNMLYGDDSGGKLVLHPAINAVAFTGSLQGGRALFDLAASRPVPIPVFAEMASINPIILLPGALTERGATIAASIAASVTLGSGQFCTKPGLIIGLAGAEFESFMQQLAEALASKPPAVMLNRSILAKYRLGVEQRIAVAGMTLLATGVAAVERAEARLFRADPELLADPERLLEQELFGPATVLVAVNTLVELLTLLPSLHGHLTASLYASDGDLAAAGQLLPVLESLVGRLILNDVPTGVEVCDAMVHGGPYPATTGSHWTSVGASSIDRFLRPICYQGYPDAILPLAMQDANPLGLRRLVDGEWSVSPIAGDVGGSSE